MVILVCIHGQDVVQLLLYKHVVTKSGDKQILYLKQRQMSLHCIVSIFVSDWTSTVREYVLISACSAVFAIIACSALMGDDVSASLVFDAS